MIVSKEWLSEYVDISLDDNEIESGLTSLGLECTLNKQNFSFKDIYVGKVLGCSKHPNANKLNVCTVKITIKVVKIKITNSKFLLIIDLNFGKFFVFIFNKFVFILLFNYLFRCVNKSKKTLIL